MLLSQGGAGEEQREKSRDFTRQVSEGEVDEEAGWQGVLATMGGQPGILSARQHAFYMHILHRLLRTASQSPPTVVSFWPGPHEMHRRTELFRSDALRRFGFRVRDEVYAQDELVTQLREIPWRGRRRVPGEPQGGGGGNGGCDPDLEFVVMAKQRSSQ